MSGSMDRRRLAALTPHTPRPAAGGRSGEEGLALIVVLMVLTLTLVLVLQLAFSSRIELRIAKNSRDEDQIYYAMRGAVLRAMASLRYDATAEGGTDLDSPSDPWANPGGAETLGEVQVEVEIEDEDRRFNVLHLTRIGEKAKEKEFLEWARASFQSLLVDFRAGTVGELSSTTARDLTRRIEEWVNRTNRAAFAPAPTESGNKMLTLDELLLMGDQDITPYLLYDHWDVDNEVLLPGLCRYVTLWSAGKVNINTAEYPVLRCLFSDRNRDEADRILDFRGEDEENIRRSDEIDRDDREDEEEDEAASNVFEKTTDLTENNVIGADAYNEISNYIDVKSSVFSIYAKATRGKVEKHVRVLVRRENQKIYTLLWEERPDRRIPPEGPPLEEEDEDGQGGGLFGTSSRRR